jgi:hypothetical protein
MKRHELKSHPEPFSAVWIGAKHHEVRSTADRVFETNDELLLYEFDPDENAYSGRWMHTRITHVTVGGTWGLPTDICVMSIEVLDKGLGS